MPTYKNSTGGQINYEAGGKIYNFPAGPRDRDGNLCTV